jgi:hypothetical protein
MLPGNIILRKLGAHRQLGGAAVLFGAFVIGICGVNKFATVLILRFFVGATQGFIQGLTLYTTLWYKRNEVATRTGMSSLQYNDQILG